MQTDTDRPTGRRKLTPQMVIARAARPGEWEAEAKGRCMSALKYAASPLGIPRRVVDLVDYLVGQTKPQDWAAGYKPLAWPPNAAIMDYLGVGLSQVKNLIRKAAEYGLIEIQERGNGNRWGYRGEDKHIVDACGFDLSPLQARFHEFEYRAAEHYALRREGKRLRHRITGLRVQILSCVDLAAELGVSGKWEALAEEARATASLRSVGYDPHQLAPIAAKLERLLAEARAALEGSDAVNSDPCGAKNRTPITPTNPGNPYSKEVQGSDGPSRPEVIPFDRFRNRPADPSHDEETDLKTGKRRGVADSVLRGFAVTPDLLVRMAPIFAEFFAPGVAPTWGTLMMVAETVRGKLGISPSAWRQACLTFGTQDTIVVLAVIAAKHAQGKVQSAGGYLRAIVRGHRSGTLHLDKTLFGLVDGKGWSRH